VFAPVMILLPSTVFGLWNVGQKTETMRRLGQIFHLSCILSAPIFAVLLFYGDLIVEMLTSSEFAAANQIIPWITFSYIALYLGDLYLTVVKLHNKTKLMIYTYTAAGLSNILGNYLLIPQLGLWGAAITTAVSMGLLAILHVVVAHRVTTTPLNMPVLASAKAFVVAVVVMWLPTTIFIEQPVLRVLSIMFSLILYVILGRIFGVVTESQFSMARNFVWSSINSLPNVIRPYVKRLPTNL
jgi:O-antigen/teichoic acid export membrane protein